MSKTDARFAKTDKKIREAFFSLLKSEGFSKLTIKQLVSKAGINRGTFYLHYLDKYDLLDKVIDNLLDDFYKITLNSSIDILIDSPNNQDEIMLYFEKFVHYIYENGEYFILLQSEKGDASFMMKLNALISKNWSKMKMFDKLSIPEGYAHNALMAMMMSLITDWVKNNFRESPEEFLKIVLGLTKNFFNNLLENK